MPGYQMAHNPHITIMLKPKLKEAEAPQERASLVLLNLLSYFFVLRGGCQSE